MLDELHELTSDEDALASLSARQGSCVPIWIHKHLQRGYTFHFQIRFHPILYAAWQQELERVE